MLLDRFHHELHWPVPRELTRPSGAGPRMLAELAQRKLGNALERLEGGLGVQVGVVSRDPTADETVPPLAIVCEFRQPVSVQVIKEAHRLAWCFSHSPLLVTLEPNQIRAWSCCEHPVLGDALDDLDAEISEVRTQPQSDTSLSGQAARALHWVELVTGRFFEKYEERFRRDSCADRLLLSNLREIRRILVEDEGLDEDVCHDLLARMIFIQFLMDRKDSSGNSALSEAKLSALHQDGILSQTYPDLGEILGDYQDTYALFEWLDARFNGDLFPGSGQSGAIRRVLSPLTAASKAPRTCLKRIKSVRKRSEGVE